MNKRWMVSIRNDHGRSNRSLNSRRISPLEKGKILRGRRIVRRVLKEGHMTRNTKTLRGRIVAAITLVLRTIAKKNTLSCSRRQLSALDGRKKHIASTIKSPQVAVGRKTRE